MNEEDPMAVEATLSTSATHFVLFAGSSQDTVRCFLFTEPNPCNLMVDEEDDSIGNKGSILYRAPIV